MEKWYEVEPDKDLTQEQELARRLDYYNTFYGTKAGRRVLLDMKRWVFDRFAGRQITAEEALAMAVLIELYNVIRNKAGAGDDMAVIDAEASVAANNLRVEKRQEPENKDPLYEG